VGYADLVVAAAGSITVIDFKSGSPPAGDIADTHPVHVEQVRSYTRLIHAAHPGARMRAALLFTADGQIAWVSA